MTSLDILDTLIEQSIASGRPSVIGICGHAGAGKTSLCKRIRETYPALAHHFVCDRFSRYSLREREARIAAAQADSLSPEAEESPVHWYAWSEIGQALASLRTNRAFSYPRGWNRQTGELDETYALTLPAEGPTLVLCDGIFLLHAPVRQWLDAAILVDTPFDVTLERGRQRTADPIRYEYMARLGRTYAVPYFAAHAAQADAIYAGAPGAMT